MAVNKFVIKCLKFTTLDYKKEICNLSMIYLCKYNKFERYLSQFR